MLLALAAASNGCGGADPNSVPALSEALKSDDPAARFTAAMLLGQHGSEARPAVPALCEALRDSDASVRMRAAYSIAEIGPDAAAVPALIALLNDPDRDVRIAAANALGAMGTEAGSALPALRQLQNDRDAGFRGELGRAIRRIELALQYRSAESRG
jgi:HEAT repeat protein